MPGRVSSNFGYAWIIFFAGRYNQAVNQALKTLEMYPDALQANYVLGWAFLGRSMLEEGIAAFEKAAAASPDPISHGYLGYAYGLAGRRDAAQNLLRDLSIRAQSEYVPRTSLAYLHAGLDNIDRAVEELEKCFEERNSQLFWFPLAVFSADLLKDPRFQALTRRMPQ